MNEEAGFLDGIQASPDDLALRLVYADWLEDQGDPRSEYLRVDAQLQKLIRLLSPTELAGEPQIRRCRARLKKLAKTLDPAWVALFDGLRPQLFTCRACKKVITAKEAIDTNPRNYRKMKSTRYCRLCYEDAVRLQMHQEFGGGSRYRETEPLYRDRDRDDD